MAQLILVDTLCKVDINGHGGERRYAQISELVNEANISSCLIEKKIFTSKLERYLNGINAVADPRTINFLLKNKSNLDLSPKAIALCSYQNRVYREALRKHVGTKLLLWDATVNYIAPYVAKELGFKVIALPHNLESLVPGQEHFYLSFDNEVKSLAKAHAVFCISREEQWLLKLRDIDADFLPYYPPKLILDNLLKIRNLRVNNYKKERFLILGTARNLTTRIGMIEQIQWLKKVRKSIDFQVDIAGYGTEAIKNYCDLEDFMVHGSVQPNQLNTLLTNTKAVIVHQKAGAGALTRIPEMLIAGIPVIANNNACRSAFDYSGVYCYDDWTELAEIMKKELTIPELLSRPFAAEKRFINCLSELLDCNNFENN